MYSNPKQNRKHFTTILVGLAALSFWVLVYSWDGLKLQSSSVYRDPIEYCTTSSWLSRSALLLSHWNAMKRADSGCQLAPMSQNDVGNSGMGMYGDVPAILDMVRGKVLIRSCRIARVPGFWSIVGWALYLSLGRCASLAGRDKHTSKPNDTKAKICDTYTAYAWAIVGYSLSLAKLCLTGFSGPTTSQSKGAAEVRELFGWLMGTGFLQLAF